MTSPDDDLALLREAAVEAGALALSFYKRDPRVWTKGASSPVSEADIAVDELLTARLTAARPDYGWLSEETADTPDRLARQRVFVVDPIDGTRGFIEGGADWCVSVAVVENGRPLAGVLRAPVHDETFEAAAGGGAYLNGGRLHASTRDTLEGARVAGPRRHIHALQERHPLSETRFVSSLAYRIALVAAGQVEVATAARNAHDWDLAAADLLVHEAGGALTDLEGTAVTYNRPDLRHPVLIAGTLPLRAAAAVVLSELEHGRAETDVGKAG